MYLYVEIQLLFIITNFQNYQQQNTLQNNHLHHALYICIQIKYISYFKYNYDIIQQYIKHQNIPIHIYIYIYFHNKKRYNIFNYQSKQKMRGLYQGGQCNPNAISSSSNQYKNMMNRMGVGNQNQQRVLQFNQQGQNFQNQILQRQAMFKQMNQGWSTSNKQMQMLQKQMQMMMSNQLLQSQQQYQLQMARIQQMNWLHAQQEIAKKQHMMNMQYQNAKIMQQAQNWQNQFKMENGFQQAKVSKQDEQRSIQNSTQNMLDVMLNDTDPRFQNSQFLHFLKRINNKQVVIQGKQIRQMGINQHMMQKAWGEGQKLYQQKQKTMRQKLQQAQKLKAQQSLRNNLSLQQHWASKLQQYQKNYKDHENYEKMLQQKYMQVLKEMNLDMTQSWQSATDLQQQLVHGDIRQNYVYNKDNPYIQAKNKKVLALQLINKGLNNQAILALQAYTQQQPQDSQGWRILGRILQQNDQDQKSITCFMNSIKFNPQNLDSLLSLGVSCTNILDQVKAMNYLKKWIILNPKYKYLNVDPNIIPQHQVDLYTYKIQDIKAMNQKMIYIFEQALMNKNDDPQLYNSLAILFFIKRDYDRAIDLFQRALTIDPTNYLLMNKVGAAMAHVGRADQAIKLYHMALSVRPNYVRVWVNLGIAHGFKGDYQQAARFYLNALSFRPDAKHIWSYLHTTFMNLQRYDLINLISTQDPKLFKQFDIIALGDLPEPDIQYKITTEKHILNKDTASWLQQFRRKQGEK